MLLYMVGSSDSPPAPPPLLEAEVQMRLDELLQSTELNCLDGGAFLTMRSLSLHCKPEHIYIAGERKITDAGFQFLLMDTYSQLWTLLKKYIALAQAMPGTIVNCKMTIWVLDQQ